MLRFTHQARARAKEGGGEGGGGGGEGGDRKSSAGKCIYKDNARPT